MLTLLDWVYVGLLLFGLGWASLLFFAGNLGTEADHSAGGHSALEADHIHAGHDLVEHHGDLATPDSTDHDVHLSPLSPIVLSTALGSLGAFGLIARHFFRLPDLVGVPFAFFGGLVLGALTFWFYGKVLLGAQGSSTISQEDFYGVTGTVIVPIPAGGTGEVSLVVRGQRVNMAARSATGEAVARNALVIVQEIQGGVAIVRSTV